MSTFCFIHGLNSSHLSFAHMAKELNSVSKINYDSHQELEKSIKHIVRQLPQNEPIILIGHSLGGILSLLIAAEGARNIQRVVTISSPLAGSKAASFARWLVGGVKVLNDITPTSKYIKRIAALEAPCPVLSIVSTGGGLTIVPEPNDSVVSIASQCAYAPAKKVEVKANHFEVLQHAKTISAIKDFCEING